MNMVFLYYDNPQMLGRQIECWNSYSGVVRNLPTVIIVDDGSVITPAIHIIKKIPCKLPLKLFRINENIAWNFSGARNLGCAHSSGWTYISDIDTMLSNENACRLFDETTLTIDQCYIPKRFRYNTEHEMRPAIVNLLFHRSKFMEVGGYDEDYAGFYGKEETDFWWRIVKATRIINRDDVKVEVFNSDDVLDANTRGFVRDKQRNSIVFEKKKSEGFPMPGPMLRFTWQQII